MPGRTAKQPLIRALAVGEFLLGNCLGAGWRAGLRGVIATSFALVEWLSTVPAGG